MNRYVPVLLVALLATLGNSVLVAQTRTPNATIAAAEQNAAPNPGQGGVDPATAAHPLRGGPQTKDEAAADGLKRLAEVSEMQVQAVGRRLNLSAGQVSRLRPILAERQKEMRALADAAGSPAPDGRARAEAIETTTQERIKGILTPAQRTQFERLLAMHEADRRRRASLAAARRERMAKPGVAPSASDAPAHAASDGITPTAPQ